MQFNILNLLLSNLLIQTLPINIPDKTTIEGLNDSFASTFLTLLILSALVLTFYSKGTTVHKVLGLLLVSIFVVFL
jgi:hypothetical protein